jgi:hypothetical protein
MLQPRVLPKVLEQANTEGVKATLYVFTTSSGSNFYRLLNINGSLLASSGTEDKHHEKLVGAILSNIWASYQKVGKTAFNPNKSQNRNNQSLDYDAYENEEYNEDDDEEQGRQPRHQAEDEVGAEKLKCMIMDLATGRIAVMGVTQRVVLCLIAEKNVELGLLRAKASAVCEYLTKPFELIDDDDDL